MVVGRVVDRLHECFFNRSVSPKLYNCFETPTGAVYLFGNYKFPLKLNQNREGGKMRVMLRMLMLLLLPALVLGAEANRRVVLDPANMGQLPLQKAISTMTQTDFSIRLAGVDLSDKAVGVSTYQEISPITDNPEKFGQTGEDGLPDLPVLAQFVAIPDQAGIRIEIISSSYQIIDNVDVYPTQPSALEGESQDAIPFTKDNGFYQRDEFYPSELVQLGEPVICRDLRLIQAVANPYQYNPVTKQLKVYTSIDYRLVYEGTDNRNIKIRRDNYISESFLELYRSIAPNADEMLASYEPIRGGYLIITPDAFPDSYIQELARWKHLKGYSVVIAHATDINSGGNPTNTQIFNYIQNAYNTWAVPPEFVCLIGDTNEGIVDYGFSGYTSDHHYSCVDGSDFLSDIMVTRMSMPNTNIIISVTVNKAVKYEKSPYMGTPAYWTRGLCAAGNITAGGAPTLSPRLNVLWAREQMLRHGYTRVDTSFGWSGYDPGTAQITAALNNGVGLFNYRGWGGSDHLGSPVYYISDFEGGVSNNNMTSVLASLTCGTGTYGGAGSCFGENWIQTGTSATAFKGGPGFYGASELGTHSKYNNPLMFGYIWSIFENNIHNFATAAFAGKMELYNTFPRANGPGTWVERYCHTFNTLGEPEFDIRTTTPQTMAITYPSTLPVGSSIMTVHVTGTGGTPLAGAYVNLVKGRATEEVFVGGRTNTNGDITLNFATTVADTMFVTVTAINYVPHLGSTLVQASPVAVNVSAIALDDDNSGNSQGNSDGNANPSETVEFDVTLRNFGNSTTATGVYATLTSPSPDIFISVPTQTYGSISPGGIATSSKFAALLAPNITQGERYILQLNITSDQGSWSAAVPVDVKNMMFRETGLTYPGNSNNRLDPGETSQLVVSLQNLGGLAGTSIDGILTTSDTCIAIVNGTASFGNIGIGATGSNSASPFSIQARAGTYNGRNVSFNLVLTSSNGSVTTRPFSLVVGNVNTYDPIGTDSYGYYLYDNTDGAYLSCPIYNWQEISTIGTRINFPFSTDDDAVVVSLPFNLQYYGQSFNYTLVSINGFIAFDTTRYDMQGHHWSTFDNGQIPEPSAPDGIIAPFWDDLEYTAPNGVFRYYDSANHRYIIEWKGCTHPRSGSSETFELIIYDNSFYPTPTGDCELVFQYNTVANDDNDGWDSGEAPGLFSTVGIQNLPNSDGLQYTYDNLYNPGAAVLQEGRAIKVTTAVGLQPPPDIAFDPTSFIKSANVGQVIYDTLTVSNVSGGLLAFTLNEFTDNGRILDDGNGSEPVIQKAVEPIGYVEVAGAKAGGETEPLYPPVIANHGGPDTYGNSWVDSDESGGPVYSWIDISGSGTSLAFVSDDEYFGPISMGITFPFYGSNYTTAYISANGVLSFGGGTTAWDNMIIPGTDAPNNFITALWDDLSPQNGGTVKYFYDSANSRFIVSYTNTPFYSGGGNVNFEMILDSSGRILFQYSSLDGGTRGLNSSTVGIEDASGSDGLQVVYNADYLHSNMAVLIYPPNFWLLSSVHGGYLPAGNDTLAVITFDATDLTAGTYTGHLDLDSNDPDEGSIDIPVSFTVGSVGTPQIQQTPASFTDTLQVGLSAPFNVKVKNTGTATLTVAFSPSAAWITTSPGPYNIASGDSILHAVTLSAVGLTPAVYNSSLISTTNDPNHLQITMPIQLRVTAPPPPNITWRPSSFSENINQGAIINRSLIIKNTGGSNLNLTLTAIEGSLIAPDEDNDNDIPGIASNGNGNNTDLPHLLNNWLFITPAADTLVPGDSLIANVRLDATVVSPGSYTGHITLVSNDPDTPSGNIPVSIMIQSVGPNCHYAVGDANNSGVFNGLDVTYSVGYFKGGPPPGYSCECTAGHTWFVAGDVNGSCSFNGLDVTYMVSYFKGGLGPVPCADCPPTSILLNPEPNEPIQSVK
jgi:hypothetical protein